MRNFIGEGFVLLVVALLFSGCTQNEHPELRPVTGMVTYNGDPLDDAIVAFYNDDSSRLASGHTDAHGKFFLTSFTQNDGAIAGEHQVVVTKADTSEDEISSVSIDAAPNASSSVVNTVRLLVPEKYTSRETTPLVVTVSDDGPNDVMIRLED